MAESEYFNNPENDDEEQDETFEPDPGTVAFLDQEAAAFAEVADEFEQMYGFRHDCHCDKDYAEGRVGEVTECYAGMIVEALAACARLNYENKHLKSMVQSLMEMNTNLMNDIQGVVNNAEDSEEAIIQEELDRMADESGIDNDTGR